MMTYRDDSISQRFPRATSAVAFAAAAVAQVSIVIALYGPPKLIAMPVIYILVHGLAGAIAGRILLDEERTPTLRGAAVRGIATIGLSLLLLWLISFAIILPFEPIRKLAVEWFEQPTVGAAAYAIITKLGLAYLHWSWWLLPLGAITGGALHEHSRRGVFESIGD
jgi:hypothetical protein